MATDSNNLVFIDVEAAAPAIKVEEVELPEIKPAKKENRPANRFKCNLCDYKTYHHALFKEHLNRHTGLKPFKCELCPYASVSKKYIKMHQDKHKTCLCGFLSQNRSEFKRHVKKCGENPASSGSHVCPSCKKEYVDEKALANHISRRQACSMCSVTLCVTEVRGHMTQVHNVHRDLRETREANKRETFQCKLCPWSSSFHQKILLHLIHHPNQNVDGCIDVTVLRKTGILTRE